MGNPLELESIIAELQDDVAAVDYSYEIENRHSLLGGSIAGKKVEQAVFIDDVSGHISKNTPTFVCTLDVQSTTWAEKACTSNQDVLDAIKVAVTKGVNTYILTGTSSSARTRSNIVSKTGVSLDLDVYNPKSGKRKKDTEYDSKGAALSELKKMWADKGYLKPTYIVDSGNGIQAHWVLGAALTIEIWQLLADSFKVKLMADGVKFDPAVPADAARVMRVPFTTNYKVVGEGIAEKATDAIRFGEKYSLDELSEMVSESSYLPSGVDEVLNNAISSSDLILPEDEYVSLEQVDYCHKYIDMSNPDRSRWMRVINATINGLQRAHMSDDIITDYLIRKCKSNLDGTRCGAYAGVSDDKQISAMVRDYDESRAVAIQFPSLIHLAREYCLAHGMTWEMPLAITQVKSDEVRVIQNGDALVDKYIYLSEPNKYLNKKTKIPITADALNRLHAHEFKSGRGIGIAAKLFDGNGKKITATSLGWLPVDNDIIELYGDRYANTYKGIAVERKKGDVSEWLDLCHYIYGEHSGLVLDHMAYSLQHPLSKIRWQILTLGTPRVGKSLTARPLVKIWGDAAGVISPSESASGWDDGLLGKKFVVHEEVYRPGDSGFFNSLKPQFANDDIARLNPKGKAQVVQQELYSMMLFTNHSNALHMDVDEDKLLVIRSPSTPWGPAERFKKLADCIEYGELTNHIYDYLLSRDVSNFSYGKLPIRTNALIEMAYEGKADYHRAIDDLAGEGKGIFSSSRECFQMSDVKHVLNSYGHKCGDAGVSKALHNLGYRKYRGRETVNSTVQATPSFWTRRNLDGYSGGKLCEWYTQNKDKF